MNNEFDAPPLASEVEDQPRVKEIKEQPLANEPLNHHARGIEEVPLA
jgi:hypothetical protein